MANFLLKWAKGAKKTVNWQKMHFNGQNRKKFRKRTLIIFWFYMKICPLAFLGAPLGWENDIFSKNRTCLIWWHISPEPLTCPEWKNIGLTLWPIRKTSFRFGGHVLFMIWPGLGFWTGTWPQAIITHNFTFNGLPCQNKEIFYLHGYHP